MRLIDADTLKYDIVEEGQRSKRYKIGEFWELNRDEIWKVIDAQPPAQPEPQKWLDHNYYLECPSCKRYVTNRTPFCPYCGGRNE